MDPARWCPSPFSRARADMGTELCRPGSRAAEWELAGNSPAPDLWLESQLPLTSPVPVPLPLLLPLPLPLAWLPPLSDEKEAAT